VAFQDILVPAEVQRRLQAGHHRRQQADGVRQQVLRLHFIPSKVKVSLSKQFFQICSYTPTFPHYLGHLEFFSPMPFSMCGILPILFTCYPLPVVISDI
jgi:hypothetical protein